MARWWNVWRDRILVEGMVVAYAAAGALIAADVLAPEYRVGRLGIASLIVAAVLTMVWKVDSCIGRVWEARGRVEERRRMELTTAADAEHLAVVHEMPQR